MELRELDFRNVKFQGQCKRKEPQGFGLALDENFTFIAGQWDKKNLSGAFLAIFDSSTILFGYLSLNDNRILVYQTPEIIIYRHNNFAIADFFHSSVLIKLNFAKTTPSVIETKTYNFQNQKLKMIASMLNLSEIPVQYRSYQNFIINNFKQKNKNLLSINDSNTQFTLSFSEQSIFMKTMKPSNRVSVIGYLEEKKANKFQIFRKYQPSGSDWMVSELINNYYDEYLLSLKPKTSIIRMRQYFRKSLTFVNQYVNLKKLYQQKAILKEASKSILKDVSNRSAQLVLQSSSLQNINGSSKNFEGKLPLDHIKREILKIKRNYPKRDLEYSPSRITYEKKQIKYDSPIKSYEDYSKNENELEESAYFQAPSYSRVSRKSTVNKSKTDRIGKFNDRSRQKLQNLTQTYKFLEKQIRKKTPRSMKGQSPYQTRYSYLEDKSETRPSQLLWNQRNQFHY